MLFPAEPPAAVAIQIGPLEIRWYGLALAAGAFVGWWLARSIGKKRGVPTDHLDRLVLILIPAGLLGGRLYHVINEVGYYLDHPDQILAIWNGGLGIHGAIGAGLIATWWYARKHSLSWWRLLDVLTPGLALGQAVGRWGNYFNQELFGRPTEGFWGLPIDEVHRPLPYAGTTHFHPTFLYESIGNFALIGILLYIFRRRPQSGTVAISYLIGYGILRILTESIRIDQTPILFGIRLPIIVSTAMILASITALILRRSPDHGRN